MTNELQNASMWLWKNKDGLKVTLTTNFGTPSFKRRFFALKGDQCKNNWRAYNLSQPEALREYFKEFKNEWRSKLKGSEFDYRISKLVEDARPHGRRVCKGAIILFEDPNDCGFVLQLGPKRFTGVFDSTEITSNQKNTEFGTCLGSWNYRIEDNENGYGEAW